MFDEAQQHGGSLRILGRGSEYQEISHRALLARGRRVAAALVDQGVASGTHVAVVGRTSTEFVVASLGVWLAGGALVVLPAPRRVASTRVWAERVSVAADKAGAKFVLPIPGVAAIPGVAELEFAEHDDIARLPELDLGSPAIIHLSSGTTSIPKAILLTHQLLMDRYMFHLTARAEDIRTSRLGWVPLGGWSMFGDVFYPMAAGGHSLLLPTDLFSARPVRWLEEISRWQVLSSGGPSAGFAAVLRSLEQVDVGDLDLSCWKRATIGGERVDHLLVEQFVRVTERFGFDPESISPGYGSTESGGMATRVGRMWVDHVLRDALESGRAEPVEGPGPGVTSFVSHGPPRELSELRVVDTGGNPLPERSLGEIWVKTPGMMKEYYGDPEATAAIFCDGWMRTGDIGYLAEGEVFVTGRIKDVIVIRGQNHSATNFEAEVKEQLGDRIAECTAVGVEKETSEDLGLVIEAEVIQDEVEALKEEVSRAVFREFAFTPDRIVIVPPGTLPRTDSGKIARNEVKQKLAEGSLGS